MKTRLSVRFNPLFIGLMITCLFAGVWSQPVPDSVLGRAATEVNQVVESARPAIVTVEGVLAGGRTIRSSGFIIDPAGWVVCSAEGVSEARSARVYLASGQAFSARVRGIDNITGIALLRLEGASGLPSLRWGSSENLPVGATAILIGNRGGLEGSVTVGTIGGKDRVGVRPTTGRVVLLLQFNGTVGAGEPGAPLLDSRGQVVGVMVGALQAVEGMPVRPAIAVTGFAIPSEIAQRAVNELRTRGSVEYAWLGVDYQSTPAGVRIVRIAPNSPAQRAGLQVNDYITGFNGQPIRSAADLTRALYMAKPNQQVEIVAIREGVSVKLSVQLGKQSL
ncbi:MAG: trypsin-like peptidase domain-containing protein [Armatimonadetes bacterium]|nr:trypsin-like peptidase domain-containing protein [Armatimonadota bacterium]CUU36670.1 serine protease, S1-C subfamily, contains C-terminal PDZ domain [Armatimonadetes bacterium DC]